MRIPIHQFTNISKCMIYLPLFLSYHLLYLYRFMDFRREFPLLQMALKPKVRRTIFLVSAFLEKRAEYSHGFFVSVFFDTPEVTKTVLTKVLQNFKKKPKCTCWPKELNQKGFPETCNTGRDQSPLPLFSALRDFFFGKKIPKGFPFNFYGIARLFSKFFFDCCRRELFLLLLSLVDMAPRRIVSARLNNLSLGSICYSEKLKDQNCVKLESLRMFLNPKLCLNGSFLRKMGV